MHRRIGGSHGRRHSILRLAAILTVVATALVGLVVSGPAGATAAETQSLELAASSSTGPKVETVFTLRPSVGLSQVADGIRSADALPIAFTHTGRSLGGNFSQGLTLDTAVEKYRRAYALIATGEPQISMFTVDGSVPTTALGSLASSVVSRQEFDPTSTPSPTSPSGTTGTAAATTSAKQFAPDSGRTVTRSFADGSRRVIVQEMTWSDQASIDAFGDDAYEHDFKLYNTDNLNIDRPLCFPGQSNRFWAARNSITYSANFPSATKPYFDTDFSDSCQTQDFTIGLYHPNRLIPGVLYRTSVITDSGSESTSPYALVAQKLPEFCDFTPDCVGVNPLDRGEGQLLIGNTKGNAPECRAWRKGEESELCPPPPLDLVFAIDTTGSMFDDIDAVKAFASDIVNLISESGSNFRVGLVDYKDHPISPYGGPGDYPSRVDLPFSSDRGAIIAAINSLSASGGGDGPEAVYSGLMAGIGLPWRQNVKKAVILMGDAPPHDPEPVTGLRAADVIAAAFAVDPAAIYPVTIGFDPAAQASFASLASATGGQAFQAARATDVVDAIRSAITAIAQTPVADAGGPYTGSTDESITFDGIASIDPDGALVRYEWDFESDGTFDTSSSEPTATHSYSSPFSGQVTLRVTDDDGHTAIAVAAVTIGAAKHTTSTTTVCDPNPAKLDQQVTCRATVNDPSAASIVSTPSGAVSWSTSGTGTFSSPQCTLSGDGATAECQVTYSGTKVGTHVITASYGGDDKHAESTATTPLLIVYDFSGLFPPVKNHPQLNAGQAGYAIPIKFSLKGFQSLDILTAGYPRSQRIPCDSDGPTGDIQPTVTAGKSALQYDPTADQYTYVWKTDKAWAGTCRQLLVMLKDGTVHAADFRF